MPKLRSKLPEAGTTIFTIMSALADEYGAMNLSQGFPNFDCDPELKRLAQQAISSGQNQYAPMTGLPSLRQKLAAKIHRLYGRQIDGMECITVTSGATQALSSAIGTVIHEGDHAIVFDPSYDAYAPSVLMYGGSFTAVPLYAPDFTIDWKAVDSAVRPETRLIIVNTPHNPLGRTLTHSDLDSLAQIATKYDLFVISDEVYEHLVFDGQAHHSILTHDALFERAFAIFSFGKIFHVTGWKLGYCVCPPDITREFQKIHQFSAFAANTPLQVAIAQFIDDPGNYEGLPAFFQRKRDYFLELMADTAFDFLRSEGSYFVLADYSRISDLPDREFAVWLTKEHGVATIPLSPFYQSAPDQKLVRFCFAKTEDLLEQATSKLKLI